MNRAAMYLILFGVIMLFFSLFTYTRTGKMVYPQDADPAFAAARNNARRRTLSYGIIMTFGAWGIAGFLQVAGINLSSLTIQFITTSILVLCWLTGVVISTWRLRLMRAKLQLAGGTDADLLKMIQGLKGARLRWALLFGLMAGVSVLGALSSILSSLTSTAN